MKRDQEMKLRQGSIELRKNNQEKMVPWKPREEWLIEDKQQGPTV